MNIFHPRLRGLTALEINVFLNQFALGMIGVFGVLFIFHLNRSNLAAGVFLVIAFFALQRVFVGLTLPLVAKLVPRIGYRYSMTLGTLGLAGKLGLFSQIDGGGLWMLIPAAALGGWHLAGYYSGYNGIFLDDNDDNKIGVQIGMMEFIGSLAAVSAPLISSILIDSAGFSLMFLVSLIVLLISVIPLWLKPLRHGKIKRVELSQVGNFYRRSSVGISPTRFWFSCGRFTLFWFWRAMFWSGFWVRRWFW